MSHIIIVITAANSNPSGPVSTPDPALARHFSITSLGIERIIPCPERCMGSSEDCAVTAIRSLFPAQFVQLQQYGLCFQPNLCGPATSRGFKGRFADSTRSGLFPESSLGRPQRCLPAASMSAWTAPGRRNDSGRCPDSAACSSRTSHSC